MRIAILVLALLPLALGAADKTRVTEPVIELFKPGDGALFRNSLVDLIRQSERIVVTEHSDPADSFDAQTMKSRIEVPIVYGTRQLTERQRAFFLETIETLNPKTQNSFSACVPVVHHTIDFYSKDVLRDTVRVCFQCNQVMWSGSRATPPGALYSALAKVVEEVGLSPRRDWRALAEQNPAMPRPGTSPQPAPEE
jgi:hypothetical protein